jgi:ABC-type sugar transport system permease subunit
MVTAGTSVAPGRRRHRRRERGLAYALLVPSLLVFVVFVFWPLVHNV